MASDSLRAYGVADEGSALFDSIRLQERRNGAEQALRRAAHDSPFGGRWLTRRANHIAGGGRL